VKAYTYLGAALMQLGRPGESFTASRTAYSLAISQRSPSVSAIAASCLQAKKAQWEEAERERVLHESQLLRDVCDTVMNAATPAAAAEKRDICRQLEVVFAHSDPTRLKMRRVPDWLIDNITFGIMWDPVVVRPPSLRPPKRGMEADADLDYPRTLLRPQHVDRPP